LEDVAQIELIDDLVDQFRDRLTARPYQVGQVVAGSMTIGSHQQIFVNCHLVEEFDRLERSADPGERSLLGRPPRDIDASIENPTRV
jgi:hypothetical protein